MLKSTLEFIEYLTNEKQESSVVQSYVKSILKLGSKEDAKLLLDSYLKNPFEFNHSYLLPVFQKFGDLDFAERIYKNLFLDGHIKEFTDPKVLILLADLKFEPIKNILFKFAFSDLELVTQFKNEAYLGLLNFDCTEFENKIKLNIKSHLNKNIFPEFLPALVCKLRDKQIELEQLYQWGDKFASTDCNAGIILGFSLCGDEGKGYFKKTLFNPNWETYSSATGTVGYVYQALKNLKISFAELYAEIKTMNQHSDIEYSLTVLFGLFRMRVIDYQDENLETFKRLFELFYSWENPNLSNNLIDLARTVGKEEEAYEFEKQFEFKVTEEIILENFLVIFPTSVTFDSISD